MQEAHILAMLVLGVCSFVAGSIPLKLTRNREQPLVLSLTLCFGGGVLFSTAIIHMLTESAEALPGIASLLFCGGFLLLYAIDEMVHLCVGDIHNLKEHSYNSSRRSSANSTVSKSENRTLTIPQTTVTNYGTLEKLPKRTRIDSVSNSFQVGCLGAETTLEPITKNEEEEDNHCCKKHEKESSFRRAAWKTQDRYLLNDDDIESASTSWHSEGRGNPCHIEVIQKPCTKSSMSLPGLLTALLIHSILEGCSIGVQTESSQILIVLAAVACHKLVLAFCMGLELANAGYEGLQFVVVIAAFAIGCPIGIGVGATLTMNSSSFYTMEAPLQAVAAGSLLYVAVFEVLPRERFKWQHRPNFKLAGLYQSIFVILGFVIMTCFDIFVGGHAHSH